MPRILKKHRKNEIRDHGQIVPTLTESHEHIGGANPPLVVLDSSTSSAESGDSDLDLKETDSNMCGVTT